MSQFPIHTRDSAPDASKPLLQGATKACGFTPKLLAGRGHCAAES
jgi:hypothetical protein